ncbi:hypothetical protein ABFS83_07G062400 [Erythranthe nasuta]
MLSSILPVSSNLTLPFLQKPQFLAVSYRPFSKSHICFSFSPSDHNPIGEEARWLREEQRWLREEQRWLREESRWNAERQILLQEISSLKLKIQELQRLNSLQGLPVSETVATIAKLMQVLKEGDSAKSVNRIADSGTSAVPLPLMFESAKTEEEEVVVKEVINIPDTKKIVKKRATLRVGSEGDEVRELQDALQKLGFYSGEEDIEFSSFASGTARAVKTWQASVGVPEDGTMTAQLLEMLFGNSGTEEYESTDREKSANGAPFTASVTEVSEVKPSVVGEYVSDNRVFLLGENRWEDPSRLSGNSKNTTNKSTSGNAKNNCLSCRGEGRLLCMECDGTGEPNIEEQFMEWVDEGAKCPYCTGLGFVTCDLCGGAK